MKKISVKSAALIAGAAALLTFSVTSFWAFQICSDSVATLRKKAKSIEDIYTVDQYIDEYYYGSYDEEIIVDQALKGMVSALDDKYEQNLIDAKGSITGIGITVNKGDNNEIKIVEIAEKGPAEKAGLKINDIIIEVDGKNVNEMEYSDAVNLVRGKAGTEVNISVKRRDEEISFKMKREEITTETVTSRMLENNIAYINDNYGHQEGDTVIKDAANILIKNQLEKTEIIRTNGNEFLIYMIGYEEKQVVSYLKKLNKELKELSHGFGAAYGYSMITDAIKTIGDAVNEATLDMKNNKEETNN